MMLLRTVVLVVIGLSWASAGSAADLDDMTIRVMDPTQPLAIDHVISLPEVRANTMKREDRKGRGEGKRAVDRRHDSEQERHRESQERHREDRDHETDRRHERESEHEMHSSHPELEAGGMGMGGGHTEPGDDTPKK